MKSMKKPVVDYREFRLSKINEPKFSHLKLLLGWPVYFLLYHVDSFKKLQTYIIITQVVATVIYIVFPNRQELRPEFFPRENVFSALVGFLYSVDTSTNGCPSLQCAYSIAIASVWLKEKGIPKGVKAAVAVTAFVICLSTAFITAFHCGFLCCHSGVYSGRAPDLRPILCLPIDGRLK